MTNQTMMSRWARSAAPLLFLVLAAVVACGDNMFAPGPQVGPPAIEQLTLAGPDVAMPDTLFEGQTLSVRVRATGDRPITHINIEFDGVIQGDTSVALAPASRTVDETIDIAVVGAAGPDSLVYIHASVTDDAQQASPVVSGNVFVNLAPASDLMLQIVETSPDSTIPLGAEIEVTVSASAPTGIRRLVLVGLAPRGDPERGTDTLVTRYTERVINYPRPGQTGLPRQVTVSPILTSPDDRTVEPLYMIVVAEDSVGNVVEATKAMYIGGPDVRMTYPPTGFETGLGAEFEVRIRIEAGSSIDSAVVTLSGEKEERIRLALPPRTDTAFVLRQLVTMPTTPGTVFLQALAWNTDEIGGMSRVVAVEVLDEPPFDERPPIVSLSAEALIPGALPRMELTDEVRVVVSAYDATAGLARVGLTMLAIREGVTDTITESVTFNGSRSLEEVEFVIPVDSIYARLGFTTQAQIEAVLPDDIELRFHGFAADTVDHVACAVGPEEQRQCTPDTYSPTGVFLAADTAGLIMRITAVRGTTVLLDNRAALVADLALDTLHERLFLSNISENLVELMDLHGDPRLNTFLAPVQVGARPWGMFVGERIVSASDASFLGGLAAVGDTAPTLIVGNSGGTNMSLVHLGPNNANVQEVDVVRLLTPNSVLYQIDEGLDDAGGISYTGVYFDFSDRPQFLAQDSLLRIVYSTVPTAAANTSTIRYIAVDPDPTGPNDVPEVRFLLTRDMVNADGSTSLALANIDSIYIQARTGQNDLVRVFTHEPGYPQNLIYNATLAEQIADAVDDVIAQIDAVMAARGVPEQAPMYYPFFMRGTWALDRVGMSDTTFVSASTDRGRIAVGEGAATPTGRILLWHADQLPQLSADVQISDLVSNASERVLGVGLNYDGSLGVARGLAATYFFTPDLRLQGLYQQPAEGGAGAAFHPDHNSVYDGGHTDTDGAGAAFTATPNQSIEVVNTFHFNRLNELFIRDNVVGPLRSGPPLSTDNNGQGRACVGADCVVAKLYGITDAGGVVILNVRRSDLQ